MDKELSGIIRDLKKRLEYLESHNQQAEAAAAQDILQEGLRYVPQAETLSREGRPEREIIQCASEWNADLIVICSRSPAFGGPALGPKSVGHVARFVLDHAPCPVLLVRPPMSEKAFLSGISIHTGIRDG